MSRLTKGERQQQLAKCWEADPFSTDREMADRFGVSVQTIRLDRMELGIPELRKRVKNMAVKTYDQVRSLPPDEVIGEVIDLELDQRGLSIFEVRDEHVFSRNCIARGHHLFAQANSLAIALMNDEVALTAKASVRFFKPVLLGDKCVAKARITRRLHERSQVVVNMYVEQSLVLRGTFDITHGPNERVIERENRD